MRSRYCAFVLENWAYLAKTQTQAFDASPTPGLEWKGLEILSGQEWGMESTVEFCAHYSLDGQAGKLHEISRFRRKNGAWLYVDGQFPKSPRIGRNEPCVCGSGRKFKKCCGC
jgi:SEC-C motif-containing protein